MKKRLLPGLLMLFLMILCWGCKEKPLYEEVHIKIIESTDVHGAIFPYDFLGNREISYSLAQFHTFVKKEREITDQEVILLDNGDILQGNPVVYLSNYIDTGKLHVCARAMNYMGYDAATVGNHDIEAGHDVYDKLVGEFNFPWMAANAVDVAINEPYFQPYTVIEKKGVKIAILGLITPGIPKWLPPQLYSGMIYEDMVQSAERWMKEIQTRVKPHLVIGLFHAGHDYTYSGGSKDDPGNENGSLLVAEKVPGFDVIFVGHDHDLLLDSLVNISGEKVYIVDPGSYSRYAGIADIRLTLNKKKYEKSISLNLVNIADFPPDPEYLEHLEGYLDRTREFVTREVANLTENITAQEALFGSSAFTDLIHRVQLDLTDADISFTAPLSITARLEKGRLTVADLFTLYRYENFLYRMRLNGREIKDYLEYAYAQWFNHMDDGSDHLLNFEVNEEGEVIINKSRGRARLKGRYYNFDSAAGIKYTVDVSKPAGERVSIISMKDGTPFAETKDYLVALNSYRGSGGGGHLTTGAGIPADLLTERIEYSSTKDLRFHMMEWMVEQELLEPQKFDNWKVIPETWWKEGMERDRKLLFPD